MLIVQLRYDDKKICADTLSEFSNIVKVLVLHSMSVEGTDIQIKFSDVQILTAAISDHDIVTCDIILNIFVHPYPERIKDAATRTQRIKKGVVEFLSSRGIEGAALVHVVFAHIEIA
jgi:hypothetical protein